MNKTLVLFTDFFPYGNGETFLETEIVYLAREFEKVIVCPRKVAEKKRNVPDNVEVVDIFGSSRNSGRLRLYLMGLVFILLNIKRLLELSYFSHFHIPGYIKSVKYTGLAAAIKRDIAVFFQKSNFDFSATVFHTYWLAYETFALGLIKQQNKLLKLVSRVHGFDLYDERGEKSLTFIKPLNLILPDRVYSISQHGRKYLIENYPHAKSKIITSYLGTTEPDFQVEPTANDTFRIVSCSGLRPVKRLDRIIDMLFHLAILKPTVNVEWHHLGDGPLRDEMESLAQEKLKGKIECHFHGQIENKDVFRYYKEIQPSLFINLSDSEGLPVSVMEAMSAGIPVMATNVGGTSEIVDENNGWLIEPETQHREMAAMLADIISSKSNIEKGKQAFLSWKKAFNAQSNYKQFTSELKNL